jgi:hypothetical protein
MPTHNDHDRPNREPEKVDTSHGYERSDVGVTGIVVFLVALSIFVAVAAALAYGIGKAINAHMAKEDGPRGKWTETVDVRQLGNMPNSPELQNKMAELTQRFPTPRLQTDDGNQDVTDLHAREDLLLENYSWVDRSQGKVRIPIERAMQLIVKQGLPVAPAVEHSKLLTGDKEPTIAVPLTSGFARTGYELDQAQAKKIEAGRQ